MVHLEAIKRAIWQRRPILGEIMKKHGDDTLYDYSQDFLDVNKSPLLDSRKHELIGIAKNLIQKRLGEKVAEGVSRQLSKIPLVSTADHHGPIDHPFWVNSNIISAIPYLNFPDPDLRYLIAFSFSSISVNNASAFPRGIEFHGRLDNASHVIRLPILPDKLKMGVVYATRGFTPQDIDRAEYEIEKQQKEEKISADRSKMILEIMEGLMKQNDVLETQDLSSQITKINYHLWPRLFHPTHKKIPDLIYLEIESLVTELLIAYHFKNPNSLIYRVLFDETYRPLVTRFFDKLAGGFDIKERTGTYFFWSLDEKLHRVRLELNTTNIFSPERGYVFQLEPMAIEKALKEKKIFPSMLLCYLVVSLYYGMKCLGGFSQVHDLTVIKEAWRKFLEEIGEHEEADAVIPVQTKELGGDGLVLSYLKTASGSLTPATGIDMVLEKEDTSFERYVELSKKVTLMEMMNPMLPEIYSVLYSSYERDPNLLTHSPAEIFQMTGLQKKIENF